MDQIVQIFDDVLTDLEKDRFEIIFADRKFPWYYIPEGTVTPDAVANHGDNNTVEYPQFNHTFYVEDTENSQYWPIAKDLLRLFFERTKIPYTDVLRARTNLQTQFNGSGEFFYNCPHHDGVELPHMVLLYYPIDSDGDTFIFDREYGQPRTTYKILERITPKKGRFVLFDGKRFHTGQHPAKSPRRIVQNYNLWLPKIIPQEFTKFE